MPSIRILPRQLRDLIAAGEVVERAASVVKELIENSIDARSSEITIEIASSGKRLIRVSDNGLGMEPEDLRVCFLPHATSKLSSKEDLFKITTMGFRGEALSSIAAVSRMKITSSPADSTVGLSIEIDEGKIIKEQQLSHTGTTVEVRDLFYNTPARKKFLKSDRTENYHIIETVTQIALCHPEISFRLKIDKRDVLVLPSTNDLRERLVQLYGIEFINGLMEISAPPVIAFISRQDNLKATRAQQYLFVNNRPVRDSYIRHAIYSAYDILLPKDRHPLYFLYLYLPPEDVDFNVHPQKTEVRFRQKNQLYNRIYHILHKCIFEKESKTAIKHVDNKTFLQKQATEVDTREAKTSANTTYNAQVVSEPLAHFCSSFEGPIYIGDVFFAYSDGTGIWIVDQHAAHERIRYERLLKSSKSALSPFLFPRQVKLPPAEFNSLEANLSWLKELIDIDVFGENTFVVRALPDFLHDADLQSLLSELARVLQEGSGRTQIEELKDGAIKTMACHSSVRGRSRLTKEELIKLIQDLQEMDDPEHCPHGRPTRVRLDIKELKRMFKRQ